MALFQNKKDYFALSFSDSLLQAAQADGGGRVRRYFEKNLPSGIIERGEIVNVEALKQALAEFLKTSRLKSKFVVVGIPEIKAFIHTLNLPLLTVEELNDAARWESEPLLPFPLAETFLDWMILEKTKEGVRVLVVALPENLVEKYSQVLESLGLQPIAFEITSLSLARLVPKEGLTSLMVEVKKQEAVLVVVGPLGGIEVSSTIMYRDATESTVEIVTTSKSLLNFYRRKIGEDQDSRKVAKILFCGEATQETMVKSLEKETGIPCSVLKIDDPKLAVIGSLARKDVAAPIDEKTINLIPTRVQGIYDKAAKIRELSFWLKLFVFGLFLILFGYSVVLARVYFEIKKFDGEIVQLQAQINPEAKELASRAKLINERAKKIISLGGSQSETVSLLSSVRQTTVPGIVINHYSYDDDKKSITVDGIANSRSDLLAFRDALKQMEKFKEVTIPLSSLEQEANVNFSIQLKRID